MSPGSSSRPPAASRPGRALRRQVLTGATDDDRDDSGDSDGSGPGSEDDDLPRSVVDPRALRFRDALAKIPDLEHGAAPPEEPGEPGPPPTSTSQQVIDLDAIPTKPRLPNTAEVDLAERLKSVPDGTPLPAVRTRLARPSRARDSLREDPEVGDEAPAEEPRPIEAPGEGPDHDAEAPVVVDMGPATDAPAAEPSILDDPVPEDDAGEETTDLDPGLDDDDDVDVVAPPMARTRSRTRTPRARTSTRAKHAKARARRTATSVPPRPPWWRSVAFAVVLLALLAAVPVLFVAGYRTITRSTDGQINVSTLSRDDPGYEELVTSTPTAVLTQLDDEGTPIGHTLLSLSNGVGGGGSVVFIPLETELANPAFGVSTLRTVVTMSPHPPAEVRPRVVPQIARLLNVGIDETFELDDAGWAQMLGPVGAIEIQNPEPVEVLDTTIEAGPVSLEPDQVGGYLETMRWGETQLNQFVRHEEVWRSWLARVASAPGETVPGESDAGLGLFIRTLAAGPVTYLTLPGDFGYDGLYRTDEAAVRDLVVDHVPAPDPASPGSRVTVRLLNGVEPSEPSTDLISQIVANKGSISVVGNASSFGADVTDIVYSDPEMEPSATFMGAVLNIGGEAYLDPTSSDTVDLTIIVGRDLHDPSGGP